MSDFYSKLIEVQATLNAPKSQFNAFGKYHYRSCEDIMGAVKPLLAKHGLVQFVSDEIELIGDRYYVKATVIVTDGKETHKVSAYARESLTKKGMDDAQVTGSTSSYARKYALNGMYNIDDSKDADTNEYRAVAQQNANQFIKQNATGFNPDESLNSALSEIESSDMDGLMNIWNKYSVELKGCNDHIARLKKELGSKKEALNGQVQAAN